MTRLAEQILVSDVSKKALQLLNQPPVTLEKGTPYEGPETPYFQDASEPSPDVVRIFVSCDLRYGSYYGDSDHWNRSETCDIPSVSFYTLLAGLEAGKAVSMEVPAKISEIDMAWGVDCTDPHETITHTQEPILVHVEMSADEKALALILLRQTANRYVPYASLQRGGSAQWLQSVRVDAPSVNKIQKHEWMDRMGGVSAVDFIQSCTSDFKFDPESSTITTDAKRTLTLSGCGWDEGYDFYCVFNATSLLTAVEYYLASGRMQDRVLLAGVEYYCNIELSGAGDNLSPDIWENPNTRPAQAEVLIDFPEKKLVLNILESKAEE